VDRRDRLRQAQGRREPQAPDRIALGFDGSKTQDATAFVGCRLIDGLLDPLGYWERPPRLKRWEEWEVPADEVHAKLAWIMATYDVVALFADPHWWRQEVDTWHGQWPDIVTRFDTSKNGRMVYAVDRIEADIDSGAVKFSPRPEAPHPLPQRLRRPDQDPARRVQRRRSSGR
jgi:hypothetical protein